MTTPSRKKLAEADADTRWLQWFAAAIPGVWIRFSSDGRYQAAGGSESEAVERARGLVGRRAADVLPGDVAGRLQEGIATAFRTGRAEIECRLRRDGAERVFDVVFASNAIQEVTAFVRDATARVAAQRRLADSERRFRSVVELANEGP